MVTVAGVGTGLPPALAGESVDEVPTTPLESVAGAGALLFIAGLTVAVALLWFWPILYDTRQANKWRAERQFEILDRLITEASRGSRDHPHGLTVEEVRQLVSAMDRSPRGTNGLTQSLLALVITLLVAVALFASLVSTAEDSSDIRKTIITSLLAVLATIAGFFFGARTAQTSTEQATRPPEARGGPLGELIGGGGPSGGDGASAVEEERAAEEHAAEEGAAEERAPDDASRRPSIPAVEPARPQAEAGPTTPRSDDRETVAEADAGNEVRRPEAPLT